MSPAGRARRLVGPQTARPSPAYPVAVLTAPFRPDPHPGARRCPPRQKAALMAAPPLLVPFGPRRRPTVGAALPSDSATASHELGPGSADPHAPGSRALRRANCESQGRQPFQAYTRKSGVGCGRRRSASCADTERGGGPHHAKLSDEAQGRWPSRGRPRSRAIPPGDSMGRGRLGGLGGCCSCHEPLMRSASRAGPQRTVLERNGSEEPDSLSRFSLAVKKMCD